VSVSACHSRYLGDEDLLQESLLDDGLWGETDLVGPNPDGDLGGEDLGPDPDGDFDPDGGGDLGGEDLGPDPDGDLGSDSDGDLGSVEPDSDGDLGEALEGNPLHLDLLDEDVILEIISSRNRDGILQYPADNDHQVDPMEPDSDGPFVPHIVDEGIHLVPVGAADVGDNPNVPEPDPAQDLEGAAERILAAREAREAREAERVRQEAIQAELDGQAADLGRRVQADLDNHAAEEAARVQAEIDAEYRAAQDWLAAQLEERQEDGIPENLAGSEGQVDPRSERSDPAFPVFDPDIIQQERDSTVVGFQESIPVQVLNGADVDQARSWLAQREAERVDRAAEARRASAARRREASHRAEMERFLDASERAEASSEKITEITIVMKTGRKSELSFNQSGHYPRIKFADADVNLNTSDFRRESVDYNSSINSFVISNDDVYRLTKQNTKYFSICLPRQDSDHPWHLDRLKILAKFGNTDYNSYIYSNPQVNRILFPGECAKFSYRDTVVSVTIGTADSADAGTDQGIMLGLKRNGIAYDSEDIGLVNDNGLDYKSIVPHMTDLYNRAEYSYLYMDWGGEDDFERNSHARYYATIYDGDPFIQRHQNNAGEMNEFYDTEVAMLYNNPSCDSGGCAYSYSWIMDESKFGVVIFHPGDYREDNGFLNKDSCASIDSRFGFRVDQADYRVNADNRFQSKELPASIFMQEGKCEGWKNW